ncbi:MAG: DUF2891 domain-containing protein [Planctomyces sp.]|nr:DUF2891 domain-containing protein [Planctomyces sp.]
MRIFLIVAAAFGLAGATIVRENFASEHRSQFTGWFFMVQPTIANSSPSQSNSNLTDDQVLLFSRLAMGGIPKEFPNKPSNVMETSADVLSPKQMHPVFYGCFDWHSSVHGHWMLARLLRQYPDSPPAAAIRTLLNEQFTEEKLRLEADHFRKPQNRSFERMYGWAWALQLVAELHTWDDPDAKRWREFLKPLEAVLVESSLSYLPKLTFPVRTGIHPDTGFALGMELDYARVVGNRELEALLIETARRFYLNDRNYPAHYEPSGTDFFSSGFNEADLMRRVLTPAEFSKWLEDFLPVLSASEAVPMTTPVDVSDVTDGHLVHLAGLNFSRAWTMDGVASALSESDPRRSALKGLAEAHFKAGMRYVDSGHYEGEHWLATFAVYYLTQKH